MTNVQNFAGFLSGLPRSKPGEELSTGPDDLAPIVFGYTFRPMEGADFDGFGGAEEGSFISEPEGTDLILILSPDGNAITIVNVSEGTEQVWKLEGVR